MLLGVVLLSSACRGNLRIFPKHKKRNAMMREIARKRGNFRGVCPVIGRLNGSVSQRISLGQDKGRPRSAIFHGSE